jgi:hypothetical protein
MKPSFPAICVIISASATTRLLAPDPPIGRTTRLDAAQGDREFAAASVVGARYGLVCSGVKGT